MKINVPYYYTVYYVPKRCRNTRERCMKSSLDVNIRELNSEEFPVAFVVEKLDWVYENEGDAVLKDVPKEIRTYKGKLYSAVRFSDKQCHAVGWWPVDRIAYDLSHDTPYSYTGEAIPEGSKVITTSEKEVASNLRKRAKTYIIFDNKVWRPCGEPMYVIMTFGLGHNHGGTSMFIDQCYNPNISKKSYFTALEREKAIAYGKAVATRRGDTESVDRIGIGCNIKVLMPEMVKRKPHKEHGDGCEFMNSLESMICETETSAEAGFLAIAMTHAEINKK